MYRDMMQTIPSRAPVVWLDRHTLISSSVENATSVAVQLLNVTSRFDAEHHCSASSSNACEPSTLAPQAQFTWWDSCIVSRPCAIARKFGHLQVTWCRVGQGMIASHETKRTRVAHLRRVAEAAPTVSRFDYPSFVVEESPFDFQLDCPTVATVGHSFRIIVK